MLLIYVSLVTNNVFLRLFSIPVYSLVKDLFIFFGPFFELLFIIASELTLYVLNTVLS